jgi:hypothetical protein
MALDRAKRDSSHLSLGPVIATNSLHTGKRLLRAHICSTWY